MSCLALMLVCLGAAVFYLRHPRQYLRVRPLPRWSGWIGATSMVIGGFIWACQLGGVAGTTAALIASMLVWVALPYVSWWKQATSKKSRTEAVSIGGHAIGRQASDTP